MTFKYEGVFCFCFLGGVVFFNVQVGIHSDVYEPVSSVFDDIFCSIFWIQCK